MNQINTIHQIGGALGISVMSRVAAYAVSPTAENVQTIAARYHVTNVGASVLMGCALLFVVFRLLDPKDRTDH